MKKQLKRLSLHRETLSRLDSQDLQHVDGGLTLHCQYSQNGLATCATCDNATCTTNLC